MRKYDPNTVNNQRNTNSTKKLGEAIRKFTYIARSDEGIFALMNHGSGGPLLLVDFFLIPNDADVHVQIGSLSRNHLNYAWSSRHVPAK